MKSLKVKKIMTANPFIISPTQTIKEASQQMKKIDCGVLPVGEQDKIIGIITDRDIVLRVVATGLSPDKVTVQEVMTKKVHSCDEDDDIEDAAEQMRKRNVARLIVTHDKKTTGIITMKCLLQGKGKQKKSNKVLHELLRA